MAGTVAYEDLDQQGRARLLGAKIQKLLTDKHMAITEFARRIESNYSVVNKWVTGSSLPRLEMADAIADALGDPKLTHYIQRAWTTKCAVCKLEFIRTEFRNQRMYCSPQCKRVARKISNYSGGSKPKRSPLEAEALLARIAVTAFCNACTGNEGVCRVSDCELRPVSPLPLFDLQQMRRDQLREDLVKYDKQKRSEASKRIWADPAYRQRQSEIQRKAREAWTPERRKAHADAIKAGRRRAGSADNAKKTLNDEIAHLNGGIGVLSRMSPEALNALGDALKGRSS